MPLPTLDDLKSYLGVSGADEDALLQRSLDGAISLAEALSGLPVRSFEKDPRPTPAFPTLYSLYFDPVPNVARVETWDEASGGWVDRLSTLQAAGLLEVEGFGCGVRYVTGLSLQRVDIPNGAAFLTDRSWRVIYNADSNAVPAALSSAVLRLAAYAYRARDAQAFEVAYSPATGEMTVPRGLPQDALQTLRACRVRQL